MQSLSSVASAYVQIAWFITLGSEQQSVSFPALLIGNQGVIKKLEESRPESRKIETLTSFVVAQRHLIFSMLLHLLELSLSSFTYIFFLAFSAADLLRYNKLLSRIKTENSNSAKCDISL